jgi:hypothetical protein
MMIKKINVFNNISYHFDVYDDKLFMIQDNTFSAYSLSQRDFLIRGKNNDSISLWIIGDNLMTQSLDERSTLVFDCKTLEKKPSIKQLLDFPYANVTSMCNNNFFFPLIIYEDKTMRGKVSLFDGNAIVEEYPTTIGLNGIFAIHNSSFVSLNNSGQIGCYNLDNEASEKWLLNLPDIYLQEDEISVGSFIIVKDRIFILCRTKYDAFTVCVDAETGEVVRKIEEVKSDLKEFNGKLYCVKGFDKIGKLNQDDFTLELFGYSQILRPIDMTIRSSNFYISGENYLFFVDGGAMPKNRFGVIDMNNGKLVHTETFAKNLLIGNLDVRGNRIFVHTSDNELHVYEFRLG